jgi:hypothetical protein
LSKNDLPMGWDLAWLLSSGTFVQSISALAGIYKVGSQIGPTVTLRASGNLDLFLVVALGFLGIAPWFLSISLKGVAPRDRFSPWCFAPLV